MIAATGQSQPKHAAKTTPSAKVQLLPGAWVDFEQGVIEGTGSCSADLFAPSADVARIKAERMARLRAEEKLRKALGQLSRDEKQRAHLAAYGGAEQVAKLDPTQARVIAVDHASSGSVSLRLSLPLNAPPPADLGGASGVRPDGGAEPSGKGSGG